MKLTPAQVRQVQRGEKTAHRVLVVAPHEVRRPPAQGKLGRANPRTGQSAAYETQTRKPGVGDSIVIRTYEPATETRDEVLEVRVQVTGVDCDTLQNLTTAHVKAEGYKGEHALSNFMHDWMVRHDTSYPPKAEALCLVCEGHKHYENHDGQTVECDQCDTVGTIQVPTRPEPEQIITRFERRHAHHLVYVVAFVHQTDMAKFLNRRQYAPPTTSIAEALDPTAPLLGPPSKQWREKAEVRRTEALRDRDGARLAGLRTEEERLAELRAMAAERNVDITSDLRVIQRRNDAIERKIFDKLDRKDKAA